MIYPLINTIKDYDWGSKTLLATHFGLNNANNKPQAELWMGGHPEGSSSVMIDNEIITLYDLIKQNPKLILGESLAKKTNVLPYLLKLLAIDKPLSIQVHPTKIEAKKGFDKENKEKIPLIASHRKFKDDNHKPELIYALTPFKAMNGFRAIDQMITLFDSVNLMPLNDALKVFKEKQNSKGLAEFFSYLLDLSEKDLSICCKQLYQQAQLGDLPSDCAEFIIICYQHYGDDVGVFSPLLLHCMTLSKGQSMFLNSQTLHAYVSGLGMEIMANSDNVLRAGLTNKYIDTKALIKNTQFMEKSQQHILCQSVTNNNVQNFDIPVDDFAIQLINCNLQNQQVSITKKGAEILLCLEGECAIKAINSTQKASVTLKKGGSVFITAQTTQYEINILGHTNAQLARAWSHL